MSKPKWRKTKISFCLLILLVIGFFCLFNTSTRWGRWLYWQGPSWKDVDRFAWRAVENDPKNVKPFAAADPNDQITQASIRAIEDFRFDGQAISEFAGQHDSTALIVTQGNSILLEEYFQGNQRDSLQLSFSVTKSIVSLLVGIAIDEGLIESIDDPITKYVDGLKPEFSQVSIRHLMSMTSGISDADEKLFDAIPAPWADQVKGYYDPNLRKLATTFTIKNEPGGTFEYHDFNPVLIAMMLENVSGVSLTEYLSEKIWRPAGMSYPARWSLDSQRHGLEKPETGLNFPALDYARLGTMLLDENQTNVSHKWREESTRPNQLAGPQDRLAGYADKRLAAERITDELADHIRSIRYGLYWWVIERDGRNDFYANGHFGQFIYISPAANLVIVRCGTGHGGLNDYHFGNAFFRLASDVKAASTTASGSTETVSETPISETWPTTEWQILRSPEDAGWSAEKLGEARVFSDNIGSAAVIVVHDGKIVQQWGIVDEPFEVYSIRKSLLSSLIGRAVEAKEIELDDTLMSLGIDDANPSLSDDEKSATVEDLLTSRSGVYHPAAYQAAIHKAERPPRGAHPPGEFFYYNNWDFNVLGTIYNQATNRDLFDDFYGRIAGPLQMQDFNLDNTEYRSEPSSQHPAYLFKMSARDLARFGLLYLRAGRWQRKQLIPSTWVAESTRTQVPKATENRSYGYLWWTYPQYGSYFEASGSGGQKLVVVPDKKIVIVHLAKEDKVGRGGVKTGDFWRLFQKILAASPKS